MLTNPTFRNSEVTHVGNKHPLQGPPARGSAHGHGGGGTRHRGRHSEPKSKEEADHLVLDRARFLREAGEDWLLALGNADGSSQQVQSERALLSQLFGQGGDERGAAGVRSLHLDWPEGQGGDHFINWTATARIPYNRRPNDQTLRRVEHARAGLVASGEIRLPGSLNNMDSAVELLKRCLKRLTSLGSSKSRGWGQIRLEGEPEVVDLPAPETSEPLPTSVRQGQPVLLRLLLRNLEPLNLATTALAGNQVETQSYIPGGRLRGAILRLADRSRPAAGCRCTGPTQRPSSGQRPLCPE